MDPEITVALDRRAPQIEEQVSDDSNYADKHVLVDLWASCEPTGGYELDPLRLASKQRHRTACVNAKHSSMELTVDTIKTDPTDARAISLVAQVEWTQTHRTLEDEYGLLGELGQMYEDEDEQASRARTRFHHHVLKKLFCDYEKDADFLFGSPGTAVMEEYAWDPEAIVDDGYQRFCERIKRHVKNARWATLEALYKQVQRSTRMQWPEGYRSVWKRRLMQLCADYERHARRKEQIGGRIEQLYPRLQKRGEVPAPFEEISAKQLGLLIGELGPIGDFDVCQQVEKYVGINLRERESGEYEGEVEITKKGRPLARKILGQMAHQLIPKGRLFGAYYRGKLQQGMRKAKAYVAVMPKILKLIVGLYKSERPYDSGRVFTHHSQYVGAG